jgi:hypothetical protein
MVRGVRTFAFTPLETHAVFFRLTLGSNRPRLTHTKPTKEPFDYALSWQEELGCPATLSIYCAKPKPPQALRGLANSFARARQICRGPE